MTNKKDMTEADFQKLLQVALMDLRIRRTLLENEMSDVNEEMRSLEKDDKLDKLDSRVQSIAADYDHYKKFVDPEFSFDADSLY